MAIVTRAEFAELCKVTTNYINTYITRKQVATCGEKGKLIDTDNPLNKLFKKKCLQNQKAAKTGETAQKKKDVVTKKATKVVSITGGEAQKEETISQLYNQVVERMHTQPETPAEKKKREDQNKKDEELVDWDMRKKIADALKAEEQAKKERIAVDKLNGRLLPTDLVQQIVSINIRNINITYENDLINLASIYCDILAGGDRSKLAQIVNAIREKLTENIRKASATAAIEIENAIDDYSEVRSRGERK